MHFRNQQTDRLAHTTVVTTCTSEINRQTDWHTPQSSQHALQKSTDRPTGTHHSRHNMHFRNQQTDRLAHTTVVTTCTSEINRQTAKHHSRHNMHFRNQQTDCQTPQSSQHALQKSTDRLPNTTVVTTCTSEINRQTDWHTPQSSQRALQKSTDKQTGTHRCHDLHSRNRQVDGLAKTAATTTCTPEINRRIDWQARQSSQLALHYQRTDRLANTGAIKTCSPSSTDRQTGKHSRHQDMLSFINRQTDWQTQQSSHHVYSLAKQQCLITFLNTDRPQHHSIDRLKERGVEKGSGRHSTFRDRERSVFNQTNIGTGSRTTLKR